MQCSWKQECASSFHLQFWITFTFFYSFASLVCIAQYSAITLCHCTVYMDWHTYDSFLTSSSVHTVFTQIKCPFALVTSAFLIRSLCFLCRRMTQLIVCYAYVSNGMELMEINTCPWAFRESQQILYTWACGILYSVSQRYKGKWNKLIIL